MGLGQSIKGHRATVDRHHQAGALLAQPDQRLARGAIALKQAVRDVMPRFMPQHPQQADQQGRAGCAIDVVIAVDRDLFLAFDRIGEARGGHVHVAEDGWVGQEIAQGGAAVALQIIRRDPAREQELVDKAVVQPEA